MAGEWPRSSLLIEKGIGAAVHRRLAIGVVGVRGHNNDLDLGALPLDPPQDLLGQGPAGGQGPARHEIGLECLDEAHRLRIILRLAHDIGDRLFAMSLRTSERVARLVNLRQSGWLLPWGLLFSRLRRIAHACRDACQVDT